MNPKYTGFKEKTMALRREYREKRKAIDKNEKAKMDAAICKYAASLASFRFSDVILLYAPLEDEVDIMPIAHEAIRRGKKVAFPRCNTEDHTMEFYFCHPDELISLAYGILEPSETCELYDRDSDTRSAVCFVPGLLYDYSGYRIGYGGGYYDRYLSAFSGTKIGVAYREFILPTIPRGRYDIKTDILLTEKNVRIPNEN